MIRLKAGDYSSQLAAKTELLKLNDTHTLGFILNKGKAGYRLYAGSYFSEKSAQREQRRLAALGYVTSLEELEVMLPTKLLSAGSFSSHEAAVAGALKLEKLGVMASVFRER